MILHGVYLRLRDGHDAVELAAVMSGLGALCADLPGCSGFEHGANIDLEGKSPDHAYGFVSRFETVQSLQDYAVNPTHKALGARLRALCEGGADGIIVYDLEVA